MGTDPETRDTPIAELVARLISQLRSDAGDVPIEDLMNRVLVDTKGGHYTGALEISAIEDQGVQVADVDLAGAPHEVDPEKLAHLLLSLAG